MKVWFALTRGLKPVLDTPGKLAAAQRYADVMLCHEMHWTEKQLREENSLAFHSDLMKILSMQSNHAEAERSRSSKASRR